MPLGQHSWGFPSTLHILLNFITGSWFLRNRSPLLFSISCGFPNLCGLLLANPIKEALRCCLTLPLGRAKRCWLPPALGLRGQLEGLEVLDASICKALPLSSVLTSHFHAGHPAKRQAAERTKPYFFFFSPFRTMVFIRLLSVCLPVMTGTQMLFCLVTSASPPLRLFKTLSRWRAASCKPASAGSAGSQPPA